MNLPQTSNKIDADVINLLVRTCKKLFYLIVVKNYRKKIVLVYRETRSECNS